MIQVENESGNIGSVRDNSPEANQEFAGAVPADLLAAATSSPALEPGLRLGSRRDLPGLSPGQVHQ
jgi:hypothetical protein